MAQPNILITGTPGTGKTTLAAALAERTGFQHINISDLVKQFDLHDGLDEKFDSYLINEDKVIDMLDEEGEYYVPAGGKIVDHHGCDWFPERFFQLVVVLRTDNTALWDRLAKREYTEHKIQENIEAEIMQVVLEEAHDSYAQSIVLELPSNTAADMQDNLDRIEAWVAEYRASQGL